VESEHKHSGSTAFTGVHSPRAIGGHAWKFHRLDLSLTLRARGSVPNWCSRRQPIHAANIFALFLPIFMDRLTSPAGQGRDPVRRRLGGGSTSIWRRLTRLRGRLAKRTFLRRAHCWTPPQVLARGGDLVGFVASVDDYPENFRYDLLQDGRPCDP
jgi:hypothetical protein